MALSGVVRQIFAVALYRYATDNDTSGSFAEQDLRSHHAFGGLGFTPSPSWVETNQTRPTIGETVGDRMQRAQGKAKELKGRAKQEAGITAGKPPTKARGAGEELEGKAQKAAGKARSSIKKATR